MTIGTSLDDRQEDPGHGILFAHIRLCKKRHTQKMHILIRVRHLAGKGLGIALCYNAIHVIEPPRTKFGVTALRRRSATSLKNDLRC